MRTLRLVCCLLGLLLVEASQHQLLSQEKEPATPEDEEPLTQGKTPLSEWWKKLKDDKSDVRWKAIDALVAQSPETEKLIDALGEEVKKDPNSFVRRSALSALEEVVSHPKEILPVLSVAINDEDFVVHARAVGLLGAAGEPAVPVLIFLLKNPEPRVRQGAGYALQRLGK